MIHHGVAPSDSQEELRETMDKLEDWVRRQVRPGSGGRVETASKKRASEHKMVQNLDKLVDDKTKFGQFVWSALLTSRTV